MYIRPILKGRYSQGEYTNLVQEMRLGDQEYHYTYFRMSASNFEKLYLKVGPLIGKNPTHAYPISAGARLAMTLRYLAHGDSQQSLGFSYRVHKSTVCNIISETCRAIGNVLFHEVLVEPKSECEWLNISKDFMNQWNFPNCLGAIDGKHIVIQAPANSGSLFFNYKKTFSIVLMAICDANYKFILVDIGCPGRNSDGGVFSNTAFYKALEHNKLNIPPPHILSDNITRAPFVFVGDEAFPLKHYMMRPYPRKDLNDSKRIFNYREIIGTVISTFNSKLHESQ